MGAGVSAIAYFLLNNFVFQNLSVYSALRGTNSAALLISSTALLGLLADTFMRWGVYRELFRVFVKFSEGLEPDARRRFSGQYYYEVLHLGAFGLWSPMDLSRQMLSPVALIGATLAFGAITGLVMALLGYPGWEALGLVSLILALIISAQALAYLASFPDDSPEMAFLADGEASRKRMSYKLFESLPKRLSSQSSEYKITVAAIFAISFTLQLGFVFHDREGQLLSQVVDATLSKAPLQSQLAGARKLLEQPNPWYINGVTAYTPKKYQEQSNYMDSECVELLSEKSSDTLQAKGYICSKALEDTARNQLKSWASRLTSKQLESLLVSK